MTSSRLTLAVIGDTMGRDDQLDGGEGQQQDEARPNPRVEHEETVRHRLDLGRPRRAKLQDQGMKVTAASASRAGDR
jgi:hypothetical protein